MTTFLLIRHGETEWNREKVFRGRKDIPLSDNGREQARLLAAALAGEPIVAIYTSPLSRAQATAVAVAEAKGLSIQTRDELIDMNFGEWEGLSVEEAQAQYLNEYKVWTDRPADFIPPGGEGLATIRSRIQSIFSDLTLTHPNETVALVSHRVICKIAICTALGLENTAFWKIQQDVCCINAFAIQDGQSTLLRMNDTCHLRIGMSERKADF